MGNNKQKELEMLANFIAKLQNSAEFAQSHAHVLGQNWDENDDWMVEPENDEYTPFLDFVQDKIDWLREHTDVEVVSDDEDENELTDDSEDNDFNMDIKYEVEVDFDIDWDNVKQNAIKGAQI